MKLKITFLRFFVPSVSSKVLFLSVSFAFQFLVNIPAGLPIFSFVYFRANLLQFRFFIIELLQSLLVLFFKSLLPCNVLGL